jgi:hypothetical protein
LANSIKLHNPGFSGKLWPVHVKPQEDELLSSWLIRLAISHGLDPQTLFSFIRPKDSQAYNDIDWYAGPKLIQALVRKTGVSARRVKTMTISAHEGWLHQEHYDYWQSFPEYLHTVNLRFCPHCLSEDDFPYFRRIWHLGLIVLCDKHNALLIERCMECGKAIRLFDLRKAVQYKHAGNLITSCQSCNVDLRKMRAVPTPGPITKEEIEFQNSLVRAMRQGWVEIPQSGCIYSHLYFRGLKALMEIGIQFLKIVCKHYRIPRFASSLFARDQFSEGTPDRRGLVGIVRRFLEDWPYGFINFWKKNKISRFYPHLFYYDEMKSLPFWFWRVVNENLIEFEYRQSQEEMFAEHRYRYKDHELIVINRRIYFLPKDR